MRRHPILINFISHYVNTTLNVDLNIYILTIVIFEESKTFKKRPTDIMYWHIVYKNAIIS